MSLGTLFTNYHTQPVVKVVAEVVPQLAVEDRETRCRRVMLEACIYRPLEAYRDYIATGMERRGLTELNEPQERTVTRLRIALEAELAR